jgi:putative endonuclease
MKYNWHVYIVRCADGTLYTGIAKDVPKRVVEHNSDNRLAARYTKSRRPVSLVYWESVKTRSEAGKREYAIKQMPKISKENMILNFISKY